MLSITVKCNDKKLTYPKGVSLLDVAKDFQNEFDEKIIAGSINGEVYELSHNLYNNSTVEFYDRTSTVGNKVYESGLLFILSYAFKEVLKSKIIVKYSLDTGIYIKSEKLISSEDLDLVKNKMNEIVKADLPIEKLLINRKEAIKYYERLGEKDKSELLKYNTNTTINLYKLEKDYDYYFYNLPVSTGYLDSFRLTLIDRNSFVITYPNVYSSKLTYKHHDKLYNSYNEYDSWYTKIGINSICDLNNKVSEGNIDDYILLSEGYQNSKLFTIAKHIVEDKNIKIILISGPSSSGKTTTSKKLQLCLKGFGINPKTLSIDDYFVDREKTPIDEEGNLDFENINAVDVDSFNKDLTKLLNGEKVKLPTYNFILGKREDINDPVVLSDNEI